MYVVVVLVSQFSHVLTISIGLHNDKQFTSIHHALVVAILQQGMTKE